MKHQTGGFVVDIDVRMSTDGTRVSETVTIAGKPVVCSWPDGRVVDPCVSAATTALQGSRLTATPIDGADLEWASMDAI